MHNYNGDYIISLRQCLVTPYHGISPYIPPTFYNTRGTLITFFMKSKHCGTRNSLVSYNKCLVMNNCDLYY